MKKTSCLLILCLLLSALTSCAQAEEPTTPADKTYLVENEDYLDLASAYDGETIQYNSSLWYMNHLADVPLPDPFVFVENGTYYIVGTNDRDVNVVDCYTTTDFSTYEHHRGIYNPALYGGWESSNAAVYAPEIYCFDGVYYMYYSANDGDGVRRCSVVVADNPLGPYIPLVNDEVDGLNVPLFMDESHPSRALDATVFEDDGKLYMYFTVTADTQHIVGVELISPYEADWSTYRELVIPGSLDSSGGEMLLEWETYRDSKLKIAEAPFMIKNQGKYYLTYSVNGCWNKYYNVCYALSDSPLGNFVKPYEEGKLWTNLLLGYPGPKDEDSMEYQQWNGFASGTGHHCFFYIGDALMIGYHAHQNRNWNSQSFTERYFALDYVYFDQNGVPFCNGPSYAVLPLPQAISGVKNIADSGTVSGGNVQNAEHAVDHYIVDCYQLDSKDNQVLLGQGKSYIDIAFDRAYEIKGIQVYNSAYYDDYVVEIEYIDFGNGNIIYYPQFCQDFYVSEDTWFIYPCSCFNVEILNTFEAETVRIGFDLPDGGSINEIVILGR